ncbi:MAG: glycosyltransferase family 2 protein [Muribaculaceae bacterium]|nr:glycosyltransferase family 2 protein [Muribaculaceae bacterium]
MKKLGVIILNWNGEELLKQFLPTAVKYTISETTDLIVADNGSSDGSVQWITNNCPEVKVIELGKNYGFAEGYNRAIRQSDYEYVVLLNSDVEVTEGWWQPLLHFMETTPEAGAAQPKIRSWHNKEMFEYAGAAGGYLDNLGYPYCRGRLFDIIEADHGQYDGPPTDVCWASGACLITRRNLYLELGGLDEKFFAHMEEIDLCCRILNVGYRVCALSESVVYHVGGASLNQGNPKKTYLNFRNNLLLLHKNLPRQKGKRKLFIRRLVDTLAWGMFLVKGDFANARAVLKSHNDFRRMKKEYTTFPDKDILSLQPGSNRSALLMRYLPFLTPKT